MKLRVYTVGERGVGFVEVLGRCCAAESFKPWSCFWKKIIVHFANYVSDERPFSMTLLSHTELSIFCINIVLLTQTILTLLMTAIFATALNIPNQIPMSCARWATGLLRSHTILSESIRISKMLLARAKKGARGNAATKMVMKPNWITAKNKKRGCFNSRLLLNDTSAST